KTWLRYLVASWPAESDRLLNEAMIAKYVALRLDGAELAIHASIGIIATCPSGDSSAVFTTTMKRASTIPPVRAAVHWCRPWYRPRTGSENSVASTVRAPTT